VQRIISRLENERACEMSFVRPTRTPPGAAVLCGLSILSLIAGMTAADAQTITYKVNQRIAKGSVKGTITTDGKTGVLAASDVVAWTLELKGVGAKLLLTNANSTFFLTGKDFSANTMHLYFNYNGKDNGFMVFQTVLYSGEQYWCNAVTTQGYDCRAGASVIPQTIYDASGQYQARTGRHKLGKAE
jgi:hypothetical protein